MSYSNKTITAWEWGGTRIGYNNHYLSDSHRHYLFQSNGVTTDGFTINAAAAVATNKNCVTMITDIDGYGWGPIPVWVNTGDNNLQSFMCYQNYKIVLSQHR